MSYGISGPANIQEEPSEVLEGDHKRSSSTLSRYRLLLVLFPIVTTIFVYVFHNLQSFLFPVHPPPLSLSFSLPSPAANVVSLSALPLHRRIQFAKIDPPDEPLRSEVNIGPNITMLNNIIPEESFIL